MRSIFPYRFRLNIPIQLRKCVIFSYFRSSTVSVHSLPKLDVYFGAVRILGYGHFHPFLASLCWDSLSYFIRFNPSASVSFRALTFTALEQCFCIVQPFQYPSLRVQQLINFHVQFCFYFRMQIVCSCCNVFLDFELLSGWVKGGSQSSKVQNRQTSILDTFSIGQFQNYDNFCKEHAAFLLSICASLTCLPHKCPDCTPCSVISPTIWSVLLFVVSSAQKILIPWNSVHYVCRLFCLPWPSSVFRFNSASYLELAALVEISVFSYQVSARPFTLLWQIAHWPLFRFLQSLL